MPSIPLYFDIFYVKFQLLVIERYFLKPQIFLSYLLFRFVKLEQFYFPKIAQISSQQKLSTLLVEYCQTVYFFHPIFSLRFKPYLFGADQIPVEIISQKPVIVCKTDDEGHFVDDYFSDLFLKVTTLDREVINYVDSVWVVLSNENFVHLV